MEYLDLGCTPARENCVQVSSREDYLPAMREECNRYRDMLRKRFADCNEVEIVVRSNPHDMGTYLSVEVKYGNKLGFAQALHIEKNLPETWSDEEVLTFDPSEYEDELEEDID